MEKYVKHLKKELQVVNQLAFVHFSQVEVKFNSGNPPHPQMEQTLGDGRLMDGWMEGFATFKQLCIKISQHNLGRYIAIPNKVHFNALLVLQTGFELNISFNHT